MRARAGAILPAYCTAWAKRCWRSARRPEVAAWAATQKFTALTPRTITSAKRLLKELRAIRERGYGLDEEEREKGVCCVAAPIRNHTGEVVAAISVAGPDAPHAARARGQHGRGGGDGRRARDFDRFGRGEEWDPSTCTAPLRRRMEDEGEESRVLGLLVAALLLPAVARGASRDGHDPRRHYRFDRRGDAGRHRDADQHRHRTGARRRRRINGEYTAPSLPTGRYTVKAELPGFKTVTRARRRRSASISTSASTLKLEVGAVEESVTVTGASPLVQTSTSELGTTVTEEQIKTLPLNGRNFVNLTRTVPGVVRGIPGANIDGAGSLAWRASASFSANGQRPRDNNYMLDGVDNNETWLQTVVLFPSVDALDEFKLQTSTYSAEFGRSLGGVVNLQIKSGTNAMHGSGFEFLRNDEFDANNYFNNLAGRAKPDFSQHQYGGTIGGADRQGQDVLLLRLPGLPRQPGRDLSVDGARRRRCARAISPSSTASSTIRSRTCRSPATSSRSAASIRRPRTFSTS